MRKWMLVMAAIFLAGCARAGKQVSPDDSAGKSKQVKSRKEDGVKVNIETTLGLIQAELFYTEMNIKRFI